MTADQAPLGYRNWPGLVGGRNWLPQPLAETGTLASGQRFGGKAVRDDA